jgi:hypothetical protein
MGSLVVDDTRLTAPVLDLVFLEPPDEPATRRECQL